MGGSNPFSFTSDSDAPIRIHCKTEVKIALTEIGGGWAGLRRTDFGRRGPWGSLARVQQETKQRGTGKREANLL